MPLTPGQKLGHFEIVSALGAGGMGEVYKARDTRLGREVALKILPPEFGNDRDRRTRFEHEARAVAALNHQGIVALYDIGAEGDTLYIVTELVDGATLRAALASGALSHRKTIELASEIADALGAAHAKGITHRDLKPENIMVTREGHAKILDFGLAKDRSPRPDGATETAVTDAGLVMGTAGYMSPEQVQALPADHRSDVFSFGAVLHEMLSGARAFAKTTQVETLTAILREDPPPLPATTPQGLQQIAARCLEKEPERRFQSMKDLAFALRSSSNATSSTHVAVAAKPKRNWLWPLVAAVCLALVFVPRGEVNGNKLKLTPIARDKMAESVPAFSPDGKSIAYLRSSGAQTQLLLRVLSESAPVVLVESVGGRTSLANSPSLSWSPDGAHIFYSNDGRPSRIAVSGGAPRPLSDGLSAAAAIPDGSGVAIVRYADGNIVQLQVTGPDGSQPKTIASYEIPVRVPIPPSSLKFSSDGRRLAFIAGGTLAIVDWPSAALHKTYRFEPLIRSFAWMPDSRHGMTGGMFRQGLQAIDTETGETRTLHTGSINQVDIRADGRAVAIVPTTLQSEIVEFSMAGENVRDIASSVEVAQAPDWSPDGRSLAYRQYLTPDTAAIVIQDLAGGQTRQVVALPVRGTIPFPYFSPDGKRIAYFDNGKLWTILASGGIATPLDSEDSGSTCWSPDGNWLLGRSGGELAKMPGGGGRAVKLQARGGGSCAWKGGSIYVNGPGGVQRVPENGGPPAPLAEIPGATISGISPDGATLYLLRPSANQLLAIDAKTGAVLKSVDIQADGLVRGVSVHRDGKRLAVWVERTVSDIWMLEGLPVPTTGFERLFHKWKDPE